MVAGVQATMLTEPSAHDSCASLDPVSAVSGGASHSDSFGYRSERRGFIGTSSMCLSTARVGMARRRELHVINSQRLHGVM